MVYVILIFFILFGPACATKRDKTKIRKPPVEYSEIILDKSIKVE